MRKNSCSAWNNYPGTIHIIDQDANGDAIGCHTADGRQEWNCSGCRFKDAGAIIGYIAPPSRRAEQVIMSVIRRSKNPDNHFFIKKDTGELVSHAYLNRKDGSYFPGIPIGTYDIYAGKKQSKSYAVLRNHLLEEWMDAEE